MSYPAIERGGEFTIPGPPSLENATPGQAAALAIAELRQLIREQREGHRLTQASSSGMLVCATDRPVPADVMVLGDESGQPVKRILIGAERAGGGLVTVPANTATNVAYHAIGRVAGSIINAGANPCYLYLASAGDVNGNVANIPVLYLTAGGSWDFRITNVLWVGHVTALSALGTTLAVANI